MSEQNNNKPNTEAEATAADEQIRTDFEDFDVTFKHDDSSNDDFTEVIIEGRGTVRSNRDEYLENVVLASGMAALQSERFRSKTRSDRAAQKALKELENRSLETLRGGAAPRAESTSPQNTVAQQNSVAKEAVEEAAQAPQQAPADDDAQMKKMKIPTAAGTAILHAHTQKLRGVGASLKSGSGQ